MKFDLMISFVPPTSVMINMLDVKNIDTFYGSSQALFKISLEIGPGEVVSLLGRNGMGKSTTVKSIMGITPVSAGTISAHP